MSIEAFQDARRLLKSPPEPWTADDVDKLCALLIKAGYSYQSSSVRKAWLSTKKSFQYRIESVRLALEGDARQGQSELLAAFRRADRMLAGKPLVEPWRDRPLTARRRAAVEACRIDPETGLAPWEHDDEARKLVE